MACWQATCHRLKYKDTISAPLMTPLSATLRTSTPRILRSPQRPADVWHSEQVCYVALSLIEGKSCTSPLIWSSSLAAVRLSHHCVIRRPQHSAVSQRSQQGAPF